MNDSVSISTEGLKEVANTINEKKDEIMKIYNTTLKSILSSSKECLSVSGLDYSQVENEFKTTFETLDKRVTELTNVLVTKIIPSYEDLSGEIKQMFNNDFASEMASILDLK